MTEDAYIVAVRRSRRAGAPADWLDRLRATPGVSVVGTVSGRAQIRADDDTVARVRADLGAYLHIEPVIEHLPTDQV